MDEKSKSISSSNEQPEERHQRLDTQFLDTALDDSFQSTSRRDFLRQVRGLGFGAAGAMLIPVGLSGREAAAATSAFTTSDAFLPPSPSSVPIVKPNEVSPAHLLTVDFRDPNALDILNQRFGAGTAVVTGRLALNEQKGIAAVDSSSGVEIRLETIVSYSGRRNLTGFGQITFEVETKAFSDPWFVNSYLDRYNAARSDPTLLPASSGYTPPPDQYNLIRLVSPTGFAAPCIRGPMPESPSGLATRANNLSVRMHDWSFQDMIVGMHSAMHGEFASITVTWWGRRFFTVFVDGAPVFMAGPEAVGTKNCEIRENYYGMNDIATDNVSRDLLRLFFGATGVFLRRVTLGVPTVNYIIHPLFEVCASYGDSFTHRGGFSNGRFPVADMWDLDNHYYFTRCLAASGYRMGYCWNNSLGGGGFLKNAPLSLWNHGGRWDLLSLVNISPTFVMMAAGHNDAAFVGAGGLPGSDGYQRRLAAVKADMLEHIQVILTGTSPSWYGPVRPSRAKIGIISTPISPRANGWGEAQSSAQRDLNAFVLNDVSDWVLRNLGSAMAARIACYDAAALFGVTGLVDYHPLFEQRGTGVHPNWWGSQLLNQAWWQCALRLGIQ